MRIKAQKNENISKRILHRPFVPESFRTPLVFDNPAGADQWRSTSPEKRIHTASPRSRKLRGEAGKEQLEPEFLVDLPALQAEYPDIKGWISIPGTCVDYPVLQSSADDPEYYLRRTYKGEWRTAGSLFFQWDCSAESQNTVVYGHNMNDGTMFAVLQKMADEAFRKEHSKILLQTSDGLREYQIAAVLKTDITKLPFNRTEFADHADFLFFQKELFAQSLYESQTIPGEDCRLLTLVTCSYEWENARTVVIAAEVR